jgi:type II secretory pathway component PulJ|tara:strand:- start:806 stop:1654 length:849 start_codon:yes stop_codon:yes gene_type:complete
MKKKFSSIAGVTLIEILIGLIISVIMMGAMYTSYSVVNSTYSQITDKAKISQSGRDIIGMLMRDVRMGGYKYFNDNIKTDSVNHAPLVITKRSGAATPVDCDKLEIVYGSVDYDKTKAVDKRYTYTKYKITYQCKPSTIIDKAVAGGKTKIQAFAIYKSKQKWDASGTGSWADPSTDGNDKTYPDQKIIDYVQDLVFHATDENGRIISPPPNPSKNHNVDKLYSIKTIDIALTMRSKNNFFKSSKSRTTHALSDTGRNITKTDKYLRDTITVSAHARNLGLQ